MMNNTKGPGFIKILREENYNGLKVMFIFMLLVVGLSFVTATDYLPHKQNTQFDFSTISNFATSCNLSTINSPSGIITIGQTVTGIGTFNFAILAGNYTTLGTYCHNII